MPDRLDEPRFLSIDPDRLDVVRKIQSAAAELALWSAPRPPETATDITARLGFDVAITRGAYADAVARLERHYANYPECAP